MKIYHLVLLGLAAGGVVNTISTSSISDSTVAPPPDSSAPVAASSDTNHTSSHSSIGSIDSTNSSTSSPTAPAGDRDIAVSMTFAVEAIADDKEMISNIEKSVAASLGGALAKNVTMNKIDVVETAPDGRRLDSKKIAVIYNVEVKESFEAAAKHAIESEIFNKDFAVAMADGTTPIVSGTDVTTKELCVIVKVAGGSLVCDEARRIPENGAVCPLTCNGTGYKTTPMTPSTYKCGTAAKWGGTPGVCEKKKCSDLTDTNGTFTCSGNQQLADSKTPCSLKCNKNYKPSVEHTALCNEAGDAWTAAKSVCEPVLCPVSVSNSKLPTDGAKPTANLLTGPTDGTIDCTTALEAKSGISCVLACTDSSFYKESESNLTCHADGKWVGKPGVCKKVCVKNGDFCKTTKGDTVIGKCAGGACEKGSGKVCAPAQIGVCGSPTMTTLKGTCNAGACNHTEGTEVSASTTFTYDDSSSEAEAKTAFKVAVAKTLKGLGVTESVDGTDVSVTKWTETRRRLNGNFLEDGPARILQVEYSVQVNQSAAADVKAALDAQSTFMYSPNST